MLLTEPQFCQNPAAFFILLRGRSMPWVGFPQEFPYIFIMPQLLSTVYEDGKKEIIVS